MMRNDEHPPGLPRPASNPPSVKVTKEIGFIVIVVAVLVCATVTRIVEKTSAETYAIILTGTLFMAAALQGGSAMKALEALLLKR